MKYLSDFTTGIILASETDLDTVKRGYLTLRLSKQFDSEINIKVGQVYLDQSTYDKFLLVCLGGEWFLFYLTGPLIGCCYFGPVLAENMEREILQSKKLVLCTIQ